MIMKAKLMTVAAMLLATMGATSALAQPGSTKIDGQDVYESRTEAAFTSTLTRAQVQDEAIKAIQDGTIAVNISKIPNIDGQLVSNGGVIAPVDVGSSTITRALVKEELMASHAKPAGIPVEAFDYL
jgi:hypothetical protein